MTLELENGAEWAGALESAYAGLGLTSREEILRLAADIETREKAAVPRAPHGGRHGASSIDTRKGVDSRGFYVDVGPTKAGFWLGFYEFGTIHQPPRPFMRPAIEQAVAAWGS